MPRGREGADMIGAAVMVARIATGEVEDTKGKAPEIGPRAARLAAARWRATIRSSE